MKHAGRRSDGRAASRRAIAYASLCLAFPCVTGAQNLYVATTGADTNPGTLAAPFQTIARADALARPGDTIHVAAGIYRVAAPSPQSEGISTSSNGTADARIRFVSGVKGGAKIVVAGTGITWHSRGN